jgi:K+-sensing histidine kinase KdpD
MLAKLQQNFMLSVTHELKTPIAGIKLNLQTLEKHRLDEETQQKFLASSITETNRLNDLCNNILVSTQLESATKAMYHEEVEIKGLVLDVISQIQQRYPSCTVTTHLMSDDFYINGDSSLWKLVISNLVENARKYSSGPIEVVLEKKQKKTVLSVKDEGVGIPDNEKEKIFEKFYRIGNENTRASKGTGLGLFIVKKIVSLYKYDIAVKNNHPKGSIFEVTFV